jgi:uridine kinase
LSVEEKFVKTRFLSVWLKLTLRTLTVLRDVAERGRDIEGVVKQWFAFVKPNFESYVEPQRKVAGILYLPALFLTFQD